MTRLERHYFRKERIINSRRFAFLLLTINIGFWILYIVNWIDPGITEIVAWIIISVMVGVTLAINQQSMTSIRKVEHMVKSDQHIKKYMNEEE